MIDDAGSQRSRKGIENTDLGSQFGRVRFSRDGVQSADAGHIEADGKDEGLYLRLGEVGR